MDADKREGQIPENRDELPEDGTALPADSDEDAEDGSPANKPGFGRSNLDDGSGTGDDAIGDDPFPDDGRPPYGRDEYDMPNRAFVPATVVLGNNGPNTRSYRKARRVWNMAIPTAVCLVLAIGAGALAVGMHTAGLLGGTPTGSAPAPEDGVQPEEEGAPSPAPEDESPEATADPDTAALYPSVHLGDGTVLHVAQGDDGLPLAGDPELVGDEMESALAYNELDESAPCTVYAYSDDAHPFAVLYDGDEAFYPAGYPAE